MNEYFYKGCFVFNIALSVVNKNAMHEYHLLNISLQWYFSWQYGKMHVDILKQDQFV